MAKVEMKNLNLKMPMPQYKQVKKNADKQGKTVTAYINDSIALALSILGDKHGQKRFVDSPDVARKIAEIPF